MNSPLILNAFLLNSPTHLNPGQTRNPMIRDLGYDSPLYWTDLAKRLEAGFFDGVFLADVLGVHTVDSADRGYCVENGVQFPVHDPAPAVAIMSAVTEHLCFGMTASVFAEHPYLFARKMATLDHLTGGRIGWNIVTSYLPSSMKALGLEHMGTHDQRYDYAREYVSLCLKLWTSSAARTTEFEGASDGALYTAAKPLQFKGEYLDFDGISISALSPQRVPLLFQAGASTKGLNFAGEFADCAFMAGRSPDETRRLADKVVRTFSEQGRSRHSYRIIPQATFIVDDTDKSAREKYEHLLAHADRRAAEILVSGWLGIDFKRLDHEKPLAQFESNAIRSFAEQFGKTSGMGAVETVGDIIEFALVGGLGMVLVGSAETLADEIASLKAGNVDGFNIPDILPPSTYDDIIGNLIPELQARGLVRDKHQAGTYRVKTLGKSERFNAAL